MRKSTLIIGFINCFLSISIFILSESNLSPSQGSVFQTYIALNPLIHHSIYFCLFPSFDQEMSIPELLQGLA